MEIKRTDNRKGWLIPYLLGLDNLFYKRWYYWINICLSDKIPQEPIPLIKFKPSNSYPEKLVNKNIQKCLDYARHISHPFENFLDWLLWGFNKGETFPNIDEKTDDYWYRNFNLGLFYEEPSDHFSDFASDYLGRNNKLGFFSTPGQVVEMMTMMTFGGLPKHEHKTKSVCDPCCGTGNMLLYASNYSLNLFGNDISGLLTKTAMINGYIYMPWIVYRPKNLTIFDEMITEIELPNGVKIPRCNKCGNEISFLLDLETEHELTISNGLISIDKPSLSKDVIKKGLKPENISCAKCIKELA